MFNFISLLLKVSILGYVGCGIAAFVMALLGKRNKNVTRCVSAKKLSVIAFVTFGVYWLMIVIGSASGAVRVGNVLGALIRFAVFGALIMYAFRISTAALKECAEAAETTAQAIPAAAAPASVPAPAPVVEQSAPAAPVQAAPVAAEVKAEPAAPAAPAVVTSATKNFVLFSKKNTCTITDQGIKYQGQEETFFAPYAEIENLYKFGLLYSFIYKGKEYSMDQNNSSGAKVQDAFTFATGCWEKARTNAPAIRALRTDGEPVYIAESFSMVLNVYNDWCTLTAKKNAANLLIMGKFFNGDKKYYYSDLTAVQFREPGKITDGYLEFEYPGSRSGKNDNSYGSENSITFGKAHTPLMREIYTFIDKRIHDSKHPAAAAAPQPQAMSAADELKKYKELLDMGVITQEEFDAKKKQVLGL